MRLTNLLHIGLTEGEISIYEALLEFGETTRTALAKRSGISPSKIYDVAGRLIEKGIVSSVKKNGILHFSAAEPERLQDFIAQKESELQREHDIVRTLLPTLHAMYAKAKEEIDVEVFYGWDGMKTVFNDIVARLAPGESNYVFGASEGHDSRQSDIFFSQYYQRKRRKGFGTKIIFNESLRGNLARTGLFSEPPNEMRFLHQDTFAEINTYKDTVLFIMLLRKPIVIRVKSAEAAASFTKFFNSLWAQARP